RAARKGSVADERTWHSGDIDVELEKVADLRLLRDFFGTKHLPCRGRKSGTQIIASERDLRDVRDGEAHALDQLALRRVASRFPAGIKADPHAPCAVDRRSVGVAIIGVDLHE